MVNAGRALLLIASMLVTMVTMVASAAAPAGLTRDGFSALQRAQASLPAAIFPFDPASVLAVRLAVTVRDPGGGSAEDEYLLWRDDAGLATHAGPLDNKVLAALQALASDRAAPGMGTPALGLHSCGDEASDLSSGSLQLEFTVLLKDHKALRLRSRARCDNMLPWNAYDGDGLRVITARVAGQALIALTQAMCAQCLQSLWPADAVQLHPATNGGGFDEHYQALKTNWQGTDAPALLQALDWMDHARLVATLQRDGVRPLVTALQVERWGYIDRKGTFKLARHYERAEAFAGGFAAVKLDGQWQQVDKAGSTWPAPPALAYRPMDAKGDPALRCDFPDASGRAVIAASFDELGPFRGELAAARKGELWGYVNAKGRWVIPARFEQAQAFSEGLAAVRLKGRWGYVDVRGRMAISPRFAEAGNFSQGLAAVR